MCFYNGRIVGDRVNVSRTGVLIELLIEVMNGFVGDGRFWLAFCWALDGVDLGQLGRRRGHL